MSDSDPFVENEIEDNKSDVNGWIVAVETLPIPESQHGVVDRFVRDCRLLITDMDNKETPSSKDLVDFTDQRNSLETRYFNITKDLQ